MKKELKEMLDERIAKLMESIDSMKPGSEEYASATEDLKKLIEASESTDKNVLDKVLVGVRIGELMLPLGFYWVWMKRGLEFERTGAFTSSVFRSLTNSFKPKQ